MAIPCSYCGGEYGHSYSCALASTTFDSKPNDPAPDIARLARTQVISVADLAVRLAALEERVAKIEGRLVPVQHPRFRDDGGW